MPDALDIFVFVCWFAGGFVSGVSGIGGTMFAFPFLALAIPMHALIPLSCLVCFFKDACMIAMHVRFCRFDAMPWLLLGAVPGSFAGVYLLQICSGAVLQGIVGILLLFFVYWQLYVHGGRGGGLCVHLGAPACQGPTAAQKKLNWTAQDIPFDKYDRNVTNWAVKAVKVLVSSI